MAVAGFYLHIRRPETVWGRAAVALLSLVSEFKRCVRVLLSGSKLKGQL